ncbi:MAG: endonuclease/exonuclease/phosphatase family protein [Ferruginibacter sp.]
MSPGIKKFLRISFIIANIAVIIFYLLACLVPFLNPGKYWPVAILGLGFPFIFFALAAFLIYWIVRKSRWSFICAGILLLGITQISVFFSFRTAEKFNAAKSSEKIRVLSWNISSWGESNRKSKTYTDYQKEMVDLIQKSNADVLCLQEYLYYKDSKYRDSIIPALKEYGYLYSYFVKANYNKRIYKTTFLTASVILSKYPITDSAYLYYSTADYTEPLIHVDLKVKEKTVRVFSTHLQSVKFEDYDYEALHKLKEPGNASISQSRAILYKLRQAYKKRASQADILKTTIKESPYPVIVCGDLNDVPNSYSYFTIKGNLQDAFLKKGSGFGRTFRFISPTLRIDYILADKKFTVAKFNKIEVPYSDHYPIITDLELENH